MQLAIGKESTYKTIAARNFVVVSRESGASYAMGFKPRYGQSYRSAYSHVADMLKPKLNAAGSLDKELAKVLLEAMLGTPTGSGRFSPSDPYVYVPLPGTQPSYSIESDTSVAGDIDIFSGCIAETLDIHITQGKAVEFQMTWLCGSYPSAGSATALSASYSLPYSYNQVAVTVNGSLFDAFGDLRLTFKSALSHKGGITVSADGYGPRRVAQRGQIDVSLAGTLDYEDNTLTTLFRNRTAFPVEILLYGSAIDSGQDEVQHVSLGGATGGTFTLTFGGQTTASLPYNASASSVQTALAALSSVGDTNVVVSGSNPYSVTFQHQLGQQALPLLTGSGAGLIGGTGLSITRGTAGQRPASESQLSFWLPACRIEQMDRAARWGETPVPNVEMVCAYGLYTGDSGTQYPVKARLFDTGAVSGVHRLLESSPAIAAKASFSAALRVSKYLAASTAPVLAVSGILSVSGATNSMAGTAAGKATVGAALAVSGTTLHLSGAVAGKATVAATLANRALSTAGGLAITDAGGGPIVTG